jgi:hypothetical protein
VIDVTTWRQEKSMTVHLVNLTNPMMMKGPFRELIPVDADVQIKVPAGLKVKDVKVLLNGSKTPHKINNGVVSLSLKSIEDHEIIGIDLG